jgi:hypothetical protein
VGLGSLETQGLRAGRVDLHSEGRAAGRGGPRLGPRRRAVGARGKARARAHTWWGRCWGSFRGAGCGGFGFGGRLGGRRLLYSGAACERGRGTLRARAGRGRRRGGRGGASRARAGRGAGRGGGGTGRAPGVAPARARGRQGAGGGALRARVLGVRTGVWLLRGAGGWRRPALPRGAGRGGRPAARARSVLNLGCSWSLGAQRERGARQNEARAPVMEGPGGFGRGRAGAWRPLPAKAAHPASKREGAPRAPKAGRPRGWARAAAPGSARPGRAAQTDGWRHARAQGCSSAMPSRRRLRRRLSESHCSGSAAFSTSIISWPRLAWSRGEGGHGVRE